MSAVAAVAPKPYRAFGNAVAMYLVFVVIGAAENVIAVRSPPSTAVVGLLAAATIFILVVALGARAVGSPRFPLGDFRRALGHVWWFWASGLLIAIAFTFQVGFPHAATRWAEWLLIGVVLAPLSEECAMRGVVQTSLNETLLGRREMFGLRIGTLIAAAESLAGGGGGIGDRLRKSVSNDARCVRQVALGDELRRGSRVGFSAGFSSRALGLSSVFGLVCSCGSMDVLVSLVRGSLSGNPESTA